MNVFDMTKEDFEKVPERVGEFNALVIIPQDYAHDSGWMCMDFVAVCRLSGCSDILKLDGIGGYGNWRDGKLPSCIEPKGWSIDCLPCGYLRLFSRRTMTALSSDYRSANKRCKHTGTACSDCRKEFWNQEVDDE
nr:MAG TPA: hypothetical protein [Caudoviricetes sp.]